VNLSITKSIEFDAGHRVPAHEGKCRSPHGHRYKVQMDVEGPLQEEGAEEGMVLDFGRLKEDLQALSDELDHAFLVWEGDTVMRTALGPSPIAAWKREKPWKVVVLPEVPTAENIAAYAYDFLAKRLAEHSSQAHLAAVRVFETPTSVAEVRP
jgi:6-pyruvoyltetrahydropterin/6-carboxytetrahydropterin synthase